MTTAVAAAALASISGVQATVSAGAAAASSFLAYDCKGDPFCAFRVTVQPTYFFLFSSSIFSACVRVGVLLLTVTALNSFGDDATGRNSRTYKAISYCDFLQLLFPFSTPWFFADAKLPPNKTRDFYKILGVKRNATTAEIDKAYRRLAKQSHPDVNEGEKERFLEIAHAHEVLRDEERRKHYDLYGEAGLNEGSTQQSGSGAPPFDFTDILGSMFGGGVDSGGSNIKFTFGGTGGGASHTFGNFGNFFPGGGQSFEEISDEALYSEEEDVAELGPQGLQRQLDARESAYLVALYDPRCRPCRQMKDEFVKAAKMLRGMVPCVAVNCSRFKSARICKDAGHYPTLLFYPPALDSKPTEHRGDRSAAAVVRFVSEHMPSGVTILSQWNFEQWLSKSPEVLKVVLFTQKKTVPLLFKFISNQMGKQIAFGLISKDQVKLVAAFRDSLLRQKQTRTATEKNSTKQSLSDVLFPSLLAIDDIDQLRGEWIDVHGHIDRELLLLKLSRLVAKARAATGTPFRELTARRMASGDCASSDPQFCFILLLPDILAARKEPPDIFMIFDLLAEKYKRDPVKLCWVNKDKQPQFAAAFDVPPGRDVTLLAYRPKRKKYEVFNAAISNISAESFINDVISGGKQPSRKVIRTPVLISQSRFVRTKSGSGHDEL